MKKLNETNCLLRQERLIEKLGKQDFFYDMEELIEPLTAKQAGATESQKQSQNQTKLESEKQIQALRDFTQTTTQAIRESSNALIKNLQKSIKEGIQEQNEITNRNNQLLTSLVDSNQVDSSIVKTVSNLLNDKKQKPI